MMSLESPGRAAPAPLPPPPPPKFPRPPPAPSPRAPAAGATGAAAAAPAARPAAGPRFSHRRSGVRAPQARHSFAQYSAVSAERLIHRFVRLVDPPGEERVVAVVITEPRPQRVAQAVDRRGGAIGDRSLDLSLLAA